MTKSLSWSCYFNFLLASAKKLWWWKSLKSNFNFIACWLMPSTAETQTEVVEKSQQREKSKPRKIMMKYMCFLSLIVHLRKILCQIWRRAKIKVAREISLMTDNIFVHSKRKRDAINFLLKIYIFHHTFFSHSIFHAKLSTCVHFLLTFKHHSWVWFFFPASSNNSNVAHFYACRRLFLFAVSIFCFLFPTAVIF